MFKTVQFLFLLIILTFSACSLKNPEQNIVKKVEPKKELKREKINNELLVTIDDIVYLIFTNQRTKLSKKYIHEKYGFFDVSLKKRIPQIKRKQIIDGKDEDYFSIANSFRRAKPYINDLTLQKFSPVFYCSPNDDAYYGWNKEGLFIDENIKFPQASNLVSKKNKSDLEFANLVDKLSYRVVLSEAEIVFFISYIDEKWYITLFDRASFDCSSD